MRVHRIETDEPIDGQYYRVFYVCDGRKVYYEVWRGVATETILPFVCIEEALNPWDAIRMAQDGQGYEFIHGE